MGHKKRPEGKSVKRRKSLKRKSIKRKDGMFRNLRQDIKPKKLLFTDYSPIKSPKKTIPLVKKRLYHETPEKKTQAKKTPHGKKRAREESQTTPEKNTNKKKAKTTPSSENKIYDLRSRLTPMMHALRIE